MDSNSPSQTSESIHIVTPSGTVRIVRSVHEIEPALRQAAFAGQCRDFRYYEIVEETLKDQFDYRYAILENPQNGERAVQPFFFVDQDLTAGLARRARAVIAKIRKTFPRFLNLRMLMVGCAAGEGQIALQSPWAIQALHDGLAIHARQTNTAIILLKEFPAEHRRDLAVFSSNGYARVPSMPGARLDLGFSSFEEYMKTRLSRVFRKNLRRKFKQSHSQPPLEFSVVQDVTDIVDELYPLYLGTHQRSEYRFETLTKEYFCQLGKRMPEKTRFFLWRQNGKLVAFSLCFLNDGGIYDMILGMDYSVALDLHLYFISWRDLIEWAIENKIQTYYTGPLNYDPKYHLRLGLDPLDLYARHTNAAINPFFRLAMKFLQPARHTPLLRKFRNVHEL